MPQNDAPLGDIVENIISYVEANSQCRKYEKDIKKKYQKYYKTTEALPDCWSHDFINKAWRKTKTMHESSRRRKCWSLAILFQLMKRSHGYDESEREAQSDVKKESPQSKGDPSANEPVHNPSANEPVYIRIPFSEMTDKKQYKASNTVAKKSLKSPQNKEYKLLDRVPSPTQILQNQFYITLYDNQTRNAAWVYEILNRNTLGIISKKGFAKKKTFKKDASVHPLFQPPTNTYSGTGYNKGHLAAAANHSWCKQARDDTYLISNAVPQQLDFNTGMWSQLEEYCREIAEKMEVRNVHVYTGPLYLSSDRESEDNTDQNESEKRVEYEIVGGKAVPTHLFKVIIVENKDGKVLPPECYKMPNANISQSKSKPEKSLIKISTLDPKSGNIIYSKESKGQKHLTRSIEKYHETLEQYNVDIKEIQKDSGLIFEEREVREEMTEGTWKAHRRKHPDEPGKGTLIEVKVSSSYTDHSDRAVLY